MKTEIPDALVDAICEVATELMVNADLSDEEEAAKIRQALAMVEDWLCEPEQEAALRRIASSGATKSV